MLDRVSVPLRHPRSFYPLPHFDMNTMLSFSRDGDDDGDDAATPAGDAESESEEM